MRLCDVRSGQASGNSKDAADKTILGRECQKSSEERIIAPFRARDKLSLTVCTERHAWSCAAAAVKRLMT